MWTLLKTIHVWEKDRQKCECGALEHSASVPVSPRVMGFLEKVDVVGIRKGENGAEAWTEDVLQF